MLVSCRKDSYMQKYPLSFRGSNQRKASSIHKKRKFQLLSDPSQLFQQVLPQLPNNGPKDTTFYNKYKTIDQKSHNHNKNPIISISDNKINRNISHSLPKIVSKSNQNQISAINLNTRQRSNSCCKSKKLIHIFIKLTNQKTISIYILPQDTISRLKQLINQKQSTQQKQYMLTFSGKSLQPCRKILDYDIKQYSTLFVLKRLNGGSVSSCGGFASLEFNNLNIPYTKKFNRTGIIPSWRRIGYGLNIKGKCINTQCKAYNKIVWCIKGYGEFYMNAEAVKSICPQCNKFIKYANNLCISHAKLEVQGMIENQLQIIRKTYTSSDNDGALTFEDKDQTRIRWSYLIFKVTRI